MYSSASVHACWCGRRVGSPASRGMVCRWRPRRSGVLPRETCQGKDSGDAKMKARTERPITWTRRLATGRAFGAVLALGLLGGVASPAFAAPPAAFTTFVDASDCLDSPNGVDCNNYRAKTDVYMNGGPVSAALTAGSYFFSRLPPGS